MSGINNPFAPTPTSVVQSTANRFPDISNDAALQQQQQQHQSQYGQQQQGYYPQQQQQQLGYLQTQQTGYRSQPPSGGAYPTSSMPASPFGAAQQPSYQGQGAYDNQAQAPYGGYPSQQQQLPQQQQFSSAPPVSFSVSDLDPYSHLGTLHQSQLSQPPSSYSSPPQQQGDMRGQDGNMALPSHLVNVQQVQTHPRQYVQENKAIPVLQRIHKAIPRADLPYSISVQWTQLLARFDTLREAWEARKSAAKQVALQGADPSAVERLTKDADAHIDSIHASKFQLAEVKDTWRQSADAASQVLPRKARVREALNAGLNSLPEYPAPLSPEQVGGAFYRRAAAEYRKQNIMSRYQQPQMTGHPQQQMQPQQYGIQAQPTGYYPPQQQQQPGGYLQSQPTGFYGGGGGGGGGWGYQQGYY